MAGRWCIKEAVYKSCYPYKPAFRDITTATTTSPPPPDLHVDGTHLGSFSEGAQAETSTLTRGHRGSGRSTIRGNGPPTIAPINGIPLTFKVSLSHDGEYAVASAISLLLSSPPPPPTSSASHHDSATTGSHTTSAASSNTSPDFSHDSEGRQDTGKNDRSASRSRTGGGDGKGRKPLLDKRGTGEMIDEYEREIPKCKDTAAAWVDQW